MTTHSQYDLSELHRVIELLRLLGVHSKQRHQFHGSRSMRNTLVYIIQEFDLDNTPFFTEYHYIDSRGQSTILRYRL